MLELTENIKNTASLYIEDREAWKDVNRVKNRKVQTWNQKL